MKFKSSWILVGQYGGYVYVHKGFYEQRPAMDEMNRLLKQEESKKNKRGARLTCHIYQLFGSYSN